MENIISQIVNTLTDIMGRFGFATGFLIIILESILPIVPLGVFVALNIMTYGTLFGFIISWLGTVIGCMASFYLFRKIGFKYENKLILKCKKYISKLSYSNLVIIMAVPFAPAFAINIGAGLSNLDSKKFFSALMVGKIPMIYFWGFIGKSFLESMTDPYTISQIIVMLVIAYLVSKLVNKFIGGE